MYFNAHLIQERLRTEKTRVQIPIAPGKGAIERYTNTPFAFWAHVVENYTQMSLT